MTTICVTLDNETLQIAQSQATEMYMTIGEYLRFIIIKDIKNAMEV